MAERAQAGLTYSRDPYDQERYQVLQTIGAEILASHSGTATKDAAAVLALESGYATPKVDVRGVVFRERKILLVRERSEQLWAVPGGWADLGESPGECAVKEVREESGFGVRPTKVLAVLDRDKHDHPRLLWHVYKIFIRCELVGGQHRGSAETDAASFFGRGELPPLSTSRVNQAQITRLFEHDDHPELPTDFD